MSKEPKQTALDIQKKLAAPFTMEVAGNKFPAIKWLPKIASKDGQKMLCMPYINRVHVQTRLNEVLGIDGWQFEVKREADGTKTGTLSIKIDGGWISRSDTGMVTKTEGEKGSTSDALKRAATHFGVGTYIATMGNRWINAKASGNKPMPVDSNGKFLYGDQLSAFLNGLSTEQGALVQLLELQPGLWQREEIKKLWNEFKIK